MGFDICGNDGGYFRNNCWWWRPLWDYVCEVCQDILAVRDMAEGSFNDGHMINERKALQIAKRLNELIKNGETEKYGIQREKELQELPDEQCNLCKGIGTRTDEWVIKEHPEGMKCNVCEGKGTRRPWITEYPFSTENVKNFAEFCEKSGGFKIF